MTSDLVMFFRVMSFSSRPSLCKGCRSDCYIIKIKIRSTCEIEDFVETHLCKLVCDTPIARITGCVSSLRI